MVMKPVRLACSQTLYFFFKVRRVIKKTKTVRDLLTFLALRARRCFRKERKEK